MTLAAVLPTARPSIWPLSCAARSSQASAKAGEARASDVKKAASQTAGPYFCTDLIGQCLARPAYTVRARAAHLSQSESVQIEPNRGSRASARNAWFKGTPASQLLRMC